MCPGTAGQPCDGCQVHVGTYAALCAGQGGLQGEVALAAPRCWQMMFTDPRFPANWGSTAIDSGICIIWYTSIIILGLVSSGSWFERASTVHFSTSPRWLKPVVSSRLLFSWSGGLIFKQHQPTISILGGTCGTSQYNQYISGGPPDIPTHTALHRNGPGVEPARKQHGFLCRGCPSFERAKVRVFDARFRCAQRQGSLWRLCRNWMHHDTTLQVSNFKPGNKKVRWKQH